MTSALRGLFQRQPVGSKATPRGSAQASRAGSSHAPASVAASDPEPVPGARKEAVKSAMHESERVLYLLQAPMPPLPQQLCQPSQNTLDRACLHTLSPAVSCSARSAGLDPTQLQTSGLVCSIRGTSRTEHGSAACTLSSPCSLLNTSSGFVCQQRSSGQGKLRCS